MISFWDERYSEEEYVYGEHPNEFFKQELDRLKPGKLLLPAEGEGRNAVYASQKGWVVTAFDQSVSGKRKAENLAQKNNVAFTYLLGTFEEMAFEPASFDAIALIFAHWPALKKSDYHKLIAEWLKPGGILILEAFSKRHLSFQEKNPSVGGPKDEAMLYSIEELSQDFAGLDVLKLEEIEIELSEGNYHKGQASVVRLVARKR